MPNGVVWLYAQSLARHSLDETSISRSEQHSTHSLFSLDSNQEEAEVAGFGPTIEGSKPSALPLGYTPL